MTKTINPCVHCKTSTAFPHGKFLDRVPTDDGYACAMCAGYECDECSKQIYVDTEVSVEATGGCFRYHAECYDAKKHGKKRKDC